MLWIEAVSVTLIMTGIVARSAASRSAFGLDRASIAWDDRKRATLGLVLALFSSVGFESATALGSEARNPLKTIPLAAKA